MKPIYIKLGEESYKLWKSVYKLIGDGRISDEVYERPDDILHGIAFSRINTLVLNYAYKNIKP